MSFKILKFNCCGLDVHKTWIYACIGITDSNNRTEYKQARFSSFTQGLNELCNWLVKYNCNDVCMESTGKYWIFHFVNLPKICLHERHPSAYDEIEKKALDNIETISFCICPK